MRLVQPLTLATSTSSGRVSVIIPTRDSAQFLERCLRSVRTQNASVDVVVVDGFSKDKSREIASEFASKILIASGTQAAARNIGLANSEGEYVLFLDSDQLLEDGVIQDCVSKCVKEEVFTVNIPEFFIGVDFWGRCSALWKNSVVKAWGPEGGIPRFYRRSALTQSSIYDSSLRFWEDLELYQRVRRIALGKEARCERHVIHYETGSLRNVARKYHSYGRSIATFTGRSARTLHTSTIRLTFSTALYLLRNPERSPTIFFGCVFQVFLKSLCAALGFLTN